MTNRASEPDRVDHWLRKGLEPEQEAARRISRQALSVTPTERHFLVRSPWALLTAAALVAVILVSIWTRGGGTPRPAREPIRITNVGQLVTAVDPTGDIWLYAPARLADANSPRFIITLGGEDAD